MGTVVRAALLYLFLLVVLRLLARRPAAHMTPFELILMFLLGGLAIQGVVGDDHSFTNVMVGLVTITLMHMLVAGLKQRSKTFSVWADGTPVLIYSEGRWDRTMMNQLRIQEGDVMACARLQGLPELNKVRFAVVERNGAISIVPYDS